MDNLKALYQEAISLFKQNDLTRAIELLEKALALSPKDPDVMEALGVIYGKQERLQDAIGLMKKLIELNPNSRQ